MANKTLLSNNAKVVALQQAYYCPSTTTQGSTVNNLISATYCFLARVDPWATEVNPDIPQETQKYFKQVQKNIFFVKRINSSDIAPVVARIDWTANTIYDFYRDDTNMMLKDNSGVPLLKFYVRNHYDQIFKCLWNNNGGQSTSEPVFDPGIYQSSGIYQSTDGYKWKYLYTIDIGRKYKFVDDNWIPVVIQTTSPNPYQTSPGFGSVDVVNVTNGGSGFNTSLAPITVTITGDGFGATANAVVNANGVITDVVMSNTGSNYTFANVAITSTVGNNATAICFTSPIGGHGFDPMSELGCSNIMYTCSITGSEANTIPTDIDYRQIGILVSPTSQDRIISGTPLPANNSVYKTSTDLLVSVGAGAYISDEIVYQGTSLANATFTATCLSFDQGASLVKTINTKGVANTSAPLYGATTGTTRTVLTINTPIFSTLSGYLAYLENITGIQRSTTGVDNFRFVVGL